MTKELELALTQTIDKSLKAVDTAVDFLSAEIPDVVLQLILFNTVWNWALVVLFSCIVLGVSIRLYKCVKLSAHDCDYIGGVIVLSILDVPLVIALFIHLKHALLITLAPKIWLIEYASTLIKGH